jgi:hypothetical protein
MAKVSSQSKKDRQIEALKKKIEKFSALCTKLQSDLQNLENGDKNVTNINDTSLLTKCNTAS